MLCCSCCCCYCILLLSLLLLSCFCLQSRKRLCTFPRRRPRACVYECDSVCLSACLSGSLSVWQPVCLSVPRMTFLGNYSSHHRQTWHCDYLRHGNASRVNYLDLDLHSHQHKKCLIISETVQAIPITFAVTIVRLKVNMTFASLITLTFFQGHKYVSNLVTF